MLNSMGSNNGEAALSVSVNIRIPGVQTAFIEVNLSSTVEELKAVIEKICGIPAVEQNLIFNARIMRGAGTLRSYGVEAANRITLIRSTPETPILDPDFELSEPEFLRLLYTNNPIMRQFVDDHPELLRPLLLVGAQNVNIDSSSTGIQTYVEEMSKLKDMGFLDTRENIRALIETAGNIEAAAWRLLSGLLPYMGFSASFRVLIETASRRVLVKIRIPNPNVETFRIEVNLSSSTVEKLKAVIEQERGIPAVEQILIYNARVMRGAGTLRSFGVEAENTLHLMRSTPEAPSSLDPDFEWIRVVYRVSEPEYLRLMYTNYPRMRQFFDHHPEFLRPLLMVGASAEIIESYSTGILLPEQRYADELSKLRGMGFLDTREIIRALIETGGNIQAAKMSLLHDMLMNIINSLDPDRAG